MKIPRFHIIFENVAGKLDERFANSAQGAKDKVIDMIRDVELRDGDVIRIVDRRDD